MADETKPIPRVTRDDPAAHSGDVVGENIAALKALFPAIVTDGKVDFDVLRQLLGDEVEEGAERYGLNWKGKSRARAFALTPSLGTLRPAKADSKDWDTTKNIVIEGDNLEVLKLLRKSYAGKIKLIYIDPPYNTGTDFVYPDNYTDSIANYEMLTGQRGDEGAKLTSNRDSSGRFHTGWLNMIYPRIMLAKDMLRDDGFLAISIDDNEVANLSTVTEELFGPEFQVALIAWEKMYTTKNDAAGFSNSHEYIAVFGKELAEVGLLPRTADMDARYTNPDDDPRGPWKAIPLSAKGERTKGRFAVVAPSGKEHFPPPDSHWLYAEADVNAMIADDRISFGRKGDALPNVKRFLSEVQQGTKARSLWSHKDAGTNDSAKREMRELFAEAKDKLPFDFPKPVTLLDRLITVLGGGPDGIVLDFFAGSGTTGHAVMARNAADGGRRRFILVQIPELLNPQKKEQTVAANFCDAIGKPRTIAELTKERLRRAGKKVKADNPDAQLDTGFRVYKLATSNLKPWQPGEDLAADLLDAASNILLGRSEDDLLVELLLKTGIDLALPGETRTIAGRSVHALGGGVLIVCLADVPAAEARALGEGIADWLSELAPPAPTTFFFKDSGFDAGGNRAAEARANLAATLRQRLGDEAIEKLGAI